MIKTFKHLPKCTEEYKQQQIQQVLEAEVIYAWECDLVQKHRWGQPAFMVFLTLIMFLLIDGYEKYFLFGIPLLIMMPVSYFLFQASERQQGQLTEHGIIVSTVELVPDVFYAATRYAAYVGIVVCLLAVIFVGPLAFVGAGAGALMAFKMTGFHNDPKVEVFPFLKELRYMIRDEFENPTYDNGVGLMNLKNMDILPDWLTDENAPDPYQGLRDFHCVLYYCNEAQQNEIRLYLDKLLHIESGKDYLQARRERAKEMNLN